MPSKTCYTQYTPYKTLKISISRDLLAIISSILYGIGDDTVVCACYGRGKEGERVKVCVRTSFFRLCSAEIELTTKLSRYCCCLYLDMEEREGKELEEDTLPARKRERERERESVCVCACEWVIVREKAGRQLCVHILDCEIYVAGVHNYCLRSVPGKKFPPHYSLSLSQCLFPFSLLQN